MTTETSLRVGRLDNRGPILDRDGDISVLCRILSHSSVHSAATCVSAGVVFSYLCLHV